MMERQVERRGEEAGGGIDCSGLQGQAGGRVSCAYDEEDVSIAIRKSVQRSEWDGSE